MKVIFFSLVFVLFLVNPNSVSGQYWAPKTITEVETQYATPYFSSTQPFKASLIIKAKSPSATKPFVFVLRFYDEGRTMGDNRALDTPSQYYVERHMPMSDFDYYHKLLNNRKKRLVRLVFRKDDAAGHDYLNVVVTRNRRIDQIYPHDDFPDD